MKERLKLLDKFQPISVGVAKGDITPHKPMKLGGYFNRLENSAAVHDSLFARVVIFGDDVDSAILIVCDLLAVGDDVVQIIRDKVNEITGVLQSRIMVSATHTHAGPVGVRNLIDQEYVKYLTKVIGEASLVAKNNLQKAHLVLKRAEVEGVSQNRRDPSYSKKEELDLIIAVDEKGKVLTSLVFFACHPTIMEYNNLEFSADFPGSAVRLIEENLGGLAVFVQGACGDINPTWTAHDWENVELNGNIVGSAALSAAYRASTVISERFAVNLSWAIDTVQTPVVGTLIPATRVEVESSSVSLERKHPESLTPLENEILELESELRKNPSLDLKKKLQPKLSLLRARVHAWKTPGPRYTPGTDHLEIQAISISKELVLVGLPGEFLFGVDKAISEKSPFSNTLIVGYANGYFDYFPLASDFQEHGYEIGRAIYGEGATEVIIEATLTLLTKMYTSKNFSQSQG
jgi:hypothetical protein